MRKTWIVRVYDNEEKELEDHEIKIVPCRLEGSAGTLIARDRVSDTIVGMLENCSINQWHDVAVEVRGKEQVCEGEKAKRQIWIIYFRNPKILQREWNS